MYETKTKKTDLSVDAYFNAIEDESRRKDCMEIAAIMQRVTDCEPYMFGTGIVGFDTYHYKYDSGHEGDACVTGFASRKGDISVYLMAQTEEREKLLAQLGKHRMGKGCLYIKRLSDVSVSVLEELIIYSVTYIRDRYPRVKSV